MQDTIATSKGHIDQKKKILKYTRAYPIKNEEALEYAFPDQEPTKHTGVVH